MRKTLAVSLTLVLLSFAAPLVAQDEETWEPFSPDQLDNLLAPIALYPDPLLAQVLVAATFPDQIDEAARVVRDDPNAEVDGQPWDASVIAVAHYPEVLGMMADKLDWTSALGQAYVNQSTDVMASVQRLRAQAQAAGNLVTTPEMEVVNSGGDIELWPAQPQYLFVPQYDPAIVFFVRAPLFFHARFAIGAWLDFDFDWHGHRVFRHDWERDRGWVERSRPYVHLPRAYAAVEHREVVINRNVVRQRVNYRTLDRYNDVHRKSSFDTFHGSWHRTPTPPPATVETVHNKIITRNIDTNDPKLREFRGHVPQPPTAVHVTDTPAFTPSQGGFEPRVASHRGQISLAHVATPPPPPPPPHPEGRHEERKHR
jgi:hypothetical protein